MGEDNTIEQIKRDVARVLEDVASLRQDVSTKGYARLEEMKHDAEKKLDMAREQMAQKAKRIDEYAHEKPWVAAGVAAAVGAIVGSLMIWKKRNR